MPGRSKGDKARAKAKSQARKTRFQAKKLKTETKAKSQAKKLRSEAKKNMPQISGAAVASAFAGAQPVMQRLLYDDELRDNIRTFIESANKILDEISDEKPAEALAKLWDDDKLRSQVEDAVEAVQQGSKRVRGEKVRKGGGSFGKVFFVISAIVAGLMIYPKTGPQARQIAMDTFNAARNAGS